MLELTALVEGLLDLHHITAFALLLCIPCSGSLQKLARKPSTHHLTASALLLDLLMFKPDLKAAPVQFSPDLVWLGDISW